ATKACVGARNVDAMREKRVRRLRCSGVSSWTGARLDDALASASLETRALCAAVGRKYEGVEPDDGEGIRGLTALTSGENCSVDLETADAGFPLSGLVMAG
ncbi:hypothetical protein Vafri_15321, partial [Volvox africanus]